MIKYSKVRDVKSPIRAHDTDAGIDFFVPKDLKHKDLVDAHSKGTIVSKINIEIEPHGRANIPSGVHVKLEREHALIAFNKSGVAAKKGLLVGACVVDSDYQGEIHINVINTNNEPVYIDLGSKLIQFLYVPIRLDQMEEVSLDNLYTEKTERGDGGFGSSDKKDQ
jgi:dUTP pyrophosphatase